MVVADDNKFGRKGDRPAGFTLLELLVVISLISLLMAISVPVLHKARRKAQVLLGSNNQRQIVGALNCFANDHDSKYPASTAKCEAGSGWFWQDPRMIAGYQSESSPVRSLGTHLVGYIDDASIICCPSAPEEYKYLQEAWDAGDEWDNPDTKQDTDSLFGTYCFYWNFTGYLAESGGIFRGPAGPAGGNGQGNVLVSDYFGYDHWRSRLSFGSCDGFPGSRVTQGTPESSAYWSRYDSEGESDPGCVGVELHAGYLDGHVSKYGSSEVVAMRLFIQPERNDLSPIFGVFYLPEDGVE